ncbi:MAG: cytochrome c biogenesis protein ResB [Opitutaceae bacterium]
MKEIGRQLFAFFSSLQLTIACLGVGMVLIFIGTIDQVHIGIYAAQAKYFQSLIVYWSPPGSSFQIPIMPGGYLIGGVLLINLFTAHFARFKPTWRKAGISLIHLGIVVLLIGELVSGLFQVDSQMRLDEGETKGYSEGFREAELVVIDTSNPEVDRVVSIPEGRLEDGGIIQHPALPFLVEIQAYYPNARIFRRGPNTPMAGPSATIGLGADLNAVNAPRTGKTDERDLTTAIVDIRGPGGSIGTWMATTGFDQAQLFTFEGKTFAIEMRPRRYYKPFTLSLLDFTHDRYPGTDIPKNFSSHVRLLDPEAGEDRDVLIYMNHPLRYAGLTFYQAGFMNDDRTSILQVVRNPGRLLPYISCVMVSLGLLFQFGMHLIQFIRRRGARS